MYRIVHSMTTLTCALRDNPAIECNNPLAAIQALHHAIQRWAQPTLLFAKVLQVVTPPPMHTQRPLILRPMRRPTKVQPQDLLPRVFIKKPKASSSAQMTPSIKENYKPVRQHTRPKVSHTVDPQPPRVTKTTDLGPIVRRTRSQTTAPANVLTLAQAAKRQ